WKISTGLAVAFVVTIGFGTGLGIVASEQGNAPGPSAGQGKPAPPPAAAADKDRAERVKKQLAVLAKQFDAVSEQIDNLRQRKLAAGPADDVDVKALRDRLEGLDSRILQAEETLGHV